MPIDYLHDAEARLTRHFSDGGWELYDGVPVAWDAALAVGDLLASVALNSGLDARRKVWQVWKGRGPIEQVLAQIPPTISLEQEYVPWDDLRNLMDACCTTTGVKWAVASKILHKKRPSLIPVYDQYMWTFYKPQVPRQRGWSEWDGRWWVGCLKVLREHLLGHKREIHCLCEFVSSNGWPITPLRALEVLIWTAYEPTGEYREATR